MPKQSFLPSPFGVNALGTTKRGIPVWSTLTVIYSVVVQPNWLLPVTENNVVLSTAAVGVAELGLFNGAAGDHTYASAPLTFNCAVGTLQFASFDFCTVNTGTGLTAIVKFIVVSNPHVLSLIYTL